MELKVQCAREGHCISRRRIARIMKQEGLVSCYTKPHYKPRLTSCNEATIENIVDREFEGREKSEVMVSDLTYVRVGNRWHYLCTLLDLHNREIIGYSVGKQNNAELVERAFASVKRNLKSIAIFPYR